MVSATPSPCSASETAGFLGGSAAGEGPARPGAAAITSHLFIGHSLLSLIVDGVRHELFRIRLQPKIKVHGLRILRLGRQRRFRDRPVQSQPGDNAYLNRLGLVIADARLVADDAPRWTELLLIDLPPFASYIKRMSVAQFQLLLHGGVIDLHVPQDGRLTIAVALFECHSPFGKRDA